MKLLGFPGPRLPCGALRLRPTTIPAGVSMLWSLAKQKGLPELRDPAEDGAYEQAKLEALGL